MLTTFPFFGHKSIRLNIFFLSEDDAHFEKFWRQEYKLRGQADSIDVKKAAPGRFVAA